MNVAILSPRSALDGRGHDTEMEVSMQSKSTTCTVPDCKRIH